MRRKEGYISPLPMLSYVFLAKGKKKEKKKKRV
jgi:hypothetical protein